MWQWWQMSLLKLRQMGTEIVSRVKSQLTYYYSVYLSTIFQIVRNDWKTSLLMAGIASCLLIGTVSLSLSAWWLYSFQAASSSVSLASAPGLTNFTDPQLATSDFGAAAAKLVVDISGAVKQPGVYYLADHSRIGQAIDQAG